ncbi:glycosyltransferase [Alkalimonas collagenimarina]|uniref:Glycosyltransferase n=1 Tax=Alkalimonas collagenimarina TaxID=400390 RepID=A0ABT9H0U8_9GAMM|nr:glycosyltransferase [Alkalimonas collagenimarina]MDP4536910.1 glycosyltransferase [Alkalimonas collagenimarina]
MKILLLADSTSPHTIKWARSLAEQGCTVLVAGLSSAPADLYQQHPAITVATLGADEQLVRQAKTRWSKLSYLKVLPRLKALIRSFQPDILHAHFASSYGLLGALCGFQPYVLSVWGSDVYAFPRKSWLHKSVLRFNLAKACALFSTSNDMARETALYTDKPLQVIPFGIDTDFFQPANGLELFPAGTLVIGAVKTLEPHYGMDVLIRAFAMLSRNLPEQKLGLLLVGSGSQQAELQQLTADEGITDQVRFTGRVPYDEVPGYHNSLDIAVVVSRRESFGVSAIESSSCGIPVVASNVDGLPEVVQHRQTGLLVPVDDVAATCAALQELVTDPALRQRLGEQGREWVQHEYDWHKNVQQMMAAYQQVLAAKEARS